MSRIKLSPEARKHFIVISIMTIDDNYHYYNEHAVIPFWPSILFASFRFSMIIGMALLMKLAENKCLKLLLVFMEN